MSPPADDSGMTMIDLMVSMVIMSVVSAVMITGITSLYRATTGAETRSEAQAQVSAALLRLDRQVRYARRIQDVDNATTVSYEVAEKAGVTRCYNVRLSGQILQQRSKAGGGSYGPWVALASGITSAAFTYADPDDTDAANHQRLTVRLTARSTGGSGVTKDFEATFTALNTTRTTAATAC